MTKEPIIADYLSFYKTRLRVPTGDTYMDQSGERVFTGEILVFETFGSVEGPALTSTVQNRVDIFSPRPIQTGAWG